MKLLITGGKSAQALKLLKAFEGHEIILADYGETPAFTSPNYTFLGLGEVNESIAHNLLNICLDHQVDTVLPLHEFEILPMAKSTVLFDEFQIRILLPSVTEVTNYFYPQDDIQPGMNWVVFKEGQLLYPAEATEAIKDLAQENQLNGVFYVPEGPDALTAILYTIR